MLHSGSSRNLPYSFSRWTEVPGDPSRWEWFKSRVRQGVFDGFDPVHSGVPRSWSLLPEDTQELIFWTKNPLALLVDRSVLAPFEGKVSVHVTCTGWGEEVERGVPGYKKVLPLLQPLVEVYGPERVTWRISPVPEREVALLLPLFDLAAGTGIKRVFCSFLQENAGMGQGLLPPWQKKEDALALVEFGFDRGMQVSFCYDDQRFAPGVVGVCSPPTTPETPTDDCGCSLAVDPFGIHESCIYNCRYCYVTTPLLGPKRHNSLTGKRRLTLL